MTDEEQLRQAMRDLRELSAQGASRSTETAVLTAFRKQHRTFNSRWKWVAMGAVAASLIVGASILRLSDPVEVEAPAKLGRVPAVQPAPPAVVPVPVTKPKRVRRPIPHIAQRMPERKFYPIPYAPPIGAGEDLQVIRVKLPEEYGRRLEADIVSGPDGIARAIRFVH